LSLKNHFMTPDNMVSPSGKDTVLEFELNEA
jgi:hypothetical protein